MAIRLHDKSFIYPWRIRTLCLASVMLLSEPLWGKGFLIDQLLLPLPLNGFGPNLLNRHRRKKVVQPKRRLQRSEYLLRRIDLFWEH